MRCRCGENRLRSAKTTVCVLEAAQEAGHSARTNRNVLADLHMVGAQRSRNHVDATFGSRVLNHQQFRWKQLTKPTVQLTDSVGRERTPSHPSTVYPLLNGNMRFGFEL